MSHRNPAGIHTRSRGRWPRVIGGLALGGAALWLAARTINYNELVYQLQTVRPIWILIALVFYWIELLVRAIRWSLILKPVGPLRFADVWTALLVGYAANNVLPARLGELVRADFVGRECAVSRMSVVGTIVIERMQDMLVVTVCAAIGLGHLVVNSGSAAMLAAALITFAIVMASGFAFLYLVTLGSSVRLLRRLPVLGIRVDAIVNGLRALKRLHLMTASLALSGVVWFFNGCSLWAILSAIDVPPDAGMVNLLIGVAGIAAAIPSAPANLGTLQFAFVTALEAVGHPATSGFAAALLIQFFLMGSVTVVGAAVYVIRTIGRPKSPASAEQP